MPQLARSYDSMLLRQLLAMQLLPESAWHAFDVAYGVKVHIA